MCWSNLRNWIKGGILFSIIFTIVFIIGQIYFPLNEEIKFEPDYFNHYLSIPGLFLLFLVAQLFFYNTEASIALIPMIYLGNILFYFVIGALVVLIVDKIKSKK